MSPIPTLGADIRVVAFEPRHAAAFRDLNLAWIERYFAIEDKDRYMLDHPDETIIASGGHILMAEDERAVAVSAVSAFCPIARGFWNWPRWPSPMACKAGASVER